MRNNLAVKICGINSQSAIDTALSNGVDYIGLVFFPPSPRYLTPIMVVLSIPISYYLFVANKNITKWLVDENKPLYNFLLNKWYFDELYDYMFVRPSKRLGTFFWKNIDIKTIDKFGPDGISNLIKNFSIRAVKFQSGFIYQYAFVMLIGFSVLLTLLILN